MNVRIGPENRTLLNLGWNQVADTYTATTTRNTVSAVHLRMRRCLLNLNGTVNYYLDPLDSTKKADGTPSVLTGADGYVMVEIPKFSFKYTYNAGQYFWEVVIGKRDGYTLHPAFIKDGVEVENRYIGAYDACVWDASTSTYISGLNLDNTDSLIDIVTDRLASVSGVYPMVGQIRARFRSLADNNGSGWRQLDFWLASAVQLLYLIEYDAFNSQQVLGLGNVSSTYLESSSNQNDSPHTIAGASNALGNRSTNRTQPSAGARPGIAYMSYRGIENFYGNCWNFVDGFNLINFAAWVTNSRANFVDDVTTNMTNVGTLASTSGFATDIVNYGGTFLPSAVGGSSTTRLTDQLFVSSGNRVALLGGSAVSGVGAGVFCWSLSNDSSFRSRSIGARACF